MKLGPRLDQTSLPLGQLAGDQFDRTNTIDGPMILVFSMKVGLVMRLSYFLVHADYYPEKAAEF